MFFLLLLNREEIEKTAKSLGLATHRVIDAGYTEVPPNTLTFIGVGPGKVSYVTCTLFTKKKKFCFILIVSLHR